MGIFTLIGIVACVILGLLLLAILGVIFIVWKLKRNLQQLAEITAPSLVTATPARVHLRRREKTVWDDETRANTYLQAIWRLGFQDAGSYEIAEMPGMKVRALARPEEELWAVIYEHPQGGLWLDFTTHFADGSSLTTTNTPHGAELEQHPDREKIFAPEADAQELYTKHTLARAGKTCKPVVPENFSSEFEKAYADAMDWRLSRGGVTEEELRTLALKKGQHLSDKELELLRQTQQAQTAVALNEAIRDRFLEQTPLSAVEWEKLRERLVIVHDQMTPEVVKTTFEEWTFENAPEFDEEESEAPAYPTELSPRQGFAHLNSTLTPARRFTKIAEVNEPVTADIYRPADTALGPYDD